MAKFGLVAIINFALMSFNKKIYPKFINYVLKSSNFVATLQNISFYSKVATVACV
jgi:hypothetical protein